MLGGRVAEELIFSEMTTGAADDIEKATGLARTMVIQFGMSALGPINLTEDRNNPYEPVTISDNVQAQIDSEINRIMQEAYKHAEKLLKANRKTLDLVAAALLKKETMESDEFEAIVGKKATPAKSAKV